MPEAEELEKTAARPPHSSSRGRSVEDWEDEILDYEEASRVDWEKLDGTIRFLWLHRKSLLRSIIIGLALATAVAFLIPKRFDATTLLMPPDYNANSGLAMLASMKSGGATAGLGAVGDLLGMKSPGELYVRGLRTHRVEDRIIERFDLQKVYGARLVYYARKKLEANSDVAEDRKSGVISITVRDSNPKRAADIANAYAEELDHLLVDVSSSSARKEREFFEERLAIAKKELDEASRDLSQFSSKNTTIDLQEQGKAMVDAAAALQGQLIAAQAELHGMLQIYTENHERVQEVRARIAELQHQLDKLGGEPGPIGTEGKQDDSMYPSIRKLPLIGVPYMDLYRRAKIREAVYEALNQEYELARLQEGRDASRIQVMDPADVPQVKAFPHRLWIMLGGTAVFFFGALAFLFAMKWWQEADPEDGRKRLLNPLVTQLSTHVFRFRVQLHCTASPSVTNRERQ